MLKKYKIYYKKQFKKRTVSQNKIFRKSLIFNYVEIKPIFFYYKVFVKFFETVKLPFYVKLYRILKKTLKNRRILFYSSFWVNKMMTEKYKNSRMGKGVGKFNKWCFYFSPFKPIFLIFFVNPFRLQFIKKYLWGNYKIRIIIQKKIISKCISYL